MSSTFTNAANDSEVTDIVKEFSLYYPKKIPFCTRKLSASAFPSNRRSPPGNSSSPAAFSSAEFRPAVYPPDLPHRPCGSDFYRICDVIFHIAPVVNIVIRLQIFYRLIDNRFRIYSLSQFFAELILRVFPALQKIHTAQFCTFGENF